MWIAYQTFHFFVLVPSTWEPVGTRRKRCPVSKDLEEYGLVADPFKQAMGSSCREIIQIERIQLAERYVQYDAHRQEFIKRLGDPNEKRLYHGCPHNAADSIIENWFNRSYAGINGEA